MRRDIDTGVRPPPSKEKFVTIRFCDGLAGSLKILKFAFSISNFSLCGYDSLALNFNPQYTILLLLPIRLFCAYGNSALRSFASGFLHSTFAFVIFPEKCFWISNSLLWLPSPVNNMIDCFGKKRRRESNGTTEGFDRCNLCLSRLMMNWSIDIHRDIWIVKIQ